VQAYNTQNTSSKEKDQFVGLQQKLQTKLSWLTDNGVDPGAKWWKSVLIGEKLRILEVGCGNGSNLKMFQSLGHETVGVEPDSKALAVARSEGHTVFHGTAETLPAESAND
jgi:SAM-dependent methyltransferase